MDVMELTIKTKRGKYQVYFYEDKIDLTCLYNQNYMDTLLKTYPTDTNLKAILKDIEDIDAE